MPPKRNGTKRVTRDEVMFAISEGRLLVETGTGELQAIEERVSGIKEVMTQHQNDIERLEGRDTIVGLFAAAATAIGSTIAAIVGSRR